MGKLSGRGSLNWPTAGKNQGVLTWGSASCRNYDKICLGLRYLKLFDKNMRNFIFLTRKMVILVITTKIQHIYNPLY